MGGVAINLLTLSGVVFAAWQVTRWVIDRSPGVFDDPGFGREMVIDLDDPGDADRCLECEGVGALVGPGLITPCPECKGTGVG